MIKQIIKFETSDGRIFDLEQNAQQHEVELKLKNFKLVTAQVQALLKKQGVSTNNSRQQARSFCKYYFDNFTIFKALEGHNITIEDKSVFDNSSPRTL